MEAIYTKNNLQSRSLRDTIQEKMDCNNNHYIEDNREETQKIQETQKQISKSTPQVSQAKIKVGSKFYDENSHGYGAALLNLKGEYYPLKSMLEKEGTYECNNWEEVKGYINRTVHNKGVIGAKTVTLKNSIYLIGEEHDKSPKGNIEEGINPTKLLYEMSLVDKEKGDGSGKLDHTLLQSMFILSVVGDEYQKGRKLGDDANIKKVFTSLEGVGEVKAVEEEIERSGSTKESILQKIAGSYNSLKGKMKSDAEYRDDKLDDGNKMWNEMQNKDMYKDQDLDENSNFCDTGDKVNDVRDYFFANQIQTQKSTPMIAIMGAKHVDGAEKYLKGAGTNNLIVYKNLAQNAEDFANKEGVSITGDGSANNIDDDLPEEMKKPKMIFKPLTSKKDTAPVDFSKFTFAPPPGSSKETSPESEKQSLFTFGSEEDFFKGFGDFPQTQSSDKPVVVPQSKDQGSSASNSSGFDGWTKF